MTYHIARLDETHPTESMALSQAVVLLAARRANQPYEQIALFDDDGFIVPRAEYIGFAICQREFKLKDVAALDKLIS